MSLPGAGSARRAGRGPLQPCVRTDGVETVSAAQSAEAGVRPRALAYSTLKPCCIGSHIQRSQALLCIKLGGLQGCLITGLLQQPLSSLVLLLLLSMPVLLVLLV